MSIVAKEIQITPKIRLGGQAGLFLIGGPCVIESRDHTLFMAEQIKNACAREDMPFVFKASFDKANRSSLASYRGPGLEEGLTILSSVKKELDIPVLSDIHEPSQAKAAAEVLDIIQIPAFLCRQTDLILAAAKTLKPLNLKKGQFLSPEDMKNVIEKAASQGNENLILTERGTFFGYNDLVFDIRSIPIMKKWKYPVVIDASHAVQKPGGMGDFSGGNAEFIPIVAHSGLCSGADGIFIEIHDKPSQAKSDSFNSLILNDLQGFLSSAKKLWSALKKENP
jgi:2-dehydro-3-deoxyphosphooctonate aldolase (KDO 8-P synthase)